MIDTIFYFVEHEADYLAQRENISPKTIVFVQDTHEIYLNGWAYGKTSTEGLATVDDYNTVVDALNTSRENINLIYQQLATLHSNIEREIEESVEQAFTDEESIRNNAVLNGQIDQKIGEWASQAYLVTTDSTTWTNLTQSVSSISARATQIDHNFDGTGDIKQSVFESGVTGTQAYTNMASRWAVADANQKVIKWLASGFASQADNNTTFADIYSAAQNNTSDAISNVHTEIQNLGNTYVAKASLVTEVQNKAQQIRTAAGVYSKSQVDNAIAGIWSENVSGTNKTLSQILTQANADSATLALKVDAGDVSAAITASVQPGGTVADYISTVTITANQINLNGLVTANSNFKILSDGSMEAKNGKFSGTIKTTTGNTITNIINSDGSGSLGNGGISWDTSGVFTLSSEVVESLYRTLNNGLQLSDPDDIQYPYRRTRMYIDKVQYSKNSNTAGVDTTITCDGISVRKWHNSNDLTVTTDNKIQIKPDGISMIVQDQAFGGGTIATSYDGVSDDVTVDGTTFVIRNGIIVGVN